MKHLFNLNFKNIFIIICLCLDFNLYAKQVEKHPAIPLPMGNFALPYSQQPGPMVSFGENILDKGKIQYSVNMIAFLGNNNIYTVVDQNLIYGITDDFSLLLSVPISPQNQEESTYSFGLNDIAAQFEYSFYNFEGKTFSHDATIVANATYPAGSVVEKPPTGYGAMTFFIGGTYNYTAVNWNIFLSSGALLTTNLLGTRRFGNEFLYQFGFAINSPSPPKTIFAWVLELDGTYAWQDKYKGIVDPDSGGNVIYLTPSFSFSTKNLIVQLGAGYPVIQNLNGNQLKQFWTPQMNLTYTF